jgi:hypothetical protein
MQDLNARFLLPGAGLPPPLSNFVAIMAVLPEASGLDDTALDQRVAMARRPRESAAIGRGDSGPLWAVHSV